MRQPLVGQDLGDDFDGHLGQYIGMRFLRMLTNAAVAGVVTAAYLTALVLLLNPQVPLASVSAGHWALAMLGFYGVLTMVAVWLLLCMLSLRQQRPNLNSGVWLGVPLGMAMLVGHQLLSDGFETVWEANQATIRARLIPDAYQGRSNAAFEGVGIVARLSGIVVGGLIGSSASGSGASLVVGGLAAVLVGLYLGISPLGRLRSIADLSESRSRSA